MDSLKIDQSFLRSLQEPEGSLAVIQSIVRMAHSMNLTVVAEGVETRAELDLVRVLGCDKVQGHVYGPARRREDVEALLAANDSLGPLEPYVGRSPCEPRLTPPSASFSYAGRGVRRGRGRPLALRAIPRAATAARPVP